MEDLKMERRQSKIDSVNSWLTELTNSVLEDVFVFVFNVELVHVLYYARPLDHLAELNVKYV